jgi:hypothetical protein
MPKKQIKVSRITLSSVLLIFLSACTLFETTADVQAKKALQDLMAIQNKYHQEHKKYAASLQSLKELNLQYDAGVVYLEIESAGTDKYRAIAIPAESTTARVFAYDTDKGGAYEMRDDEVKTYVLGALKPIRTQQNDVRVKDCISFAMAFFLAVMGINAIFKTAEKKSVPVFLPYFSSIFPMTWSLIILNHMEKNIAFSRSILGVIVAALVCAISSILGSWISIAKLPDGSPALKSLLISAITGSLLSCWVMVYTLYRFYQT